MISQVSTKEYKQEIYNVGLSSANVSKRELCEIIKQKVPNFTIMEAEIGVDPDQRNYIVSNDKLESTGYTPKYLLEFGVSELIKGFSMLKNTKYGNI